MLAKIAEQLEEGLRRSYRDRAAGLFDAGNRDPGGRRRTPGALGHESRSAQPGWARWRGPDRWRRSRRHRRKRSGSVRCCPIQLRRSRCRSCTRTSCTACCMWRSSKPTDFSEEEILLLRTLADLISGALHNALTFQKAQEQAITDGLTGVKTHRFFMEALSAEWKRSTRAGRSFSLVLMDLDRFKFVNDFYGHLEGDLVLQRVGHILEAELPALGCGGAVRRRRIRDPDAGNERRASAAAGDEAARLGLRPIRCCARKISPRALALRAFHCMDRRRRS